MPFFVLGDGGPIRQKPQSANMRSLLLFALLPLAAWAQSCTIGQGSTQSCANHIAVIVDSTSYMGSAGRTTQLAKYINTYLSQYDLSSGNTLVTMGFYGMSDPSQSWSPIFLFFGQSDPSMICEDWTTLLQYQANNNMGSCSIATALASLFNTTEGNDWNFDQIVWFTGSTDQTDIRLAGTFIADFPGTNFTVININAADFSSWKNTRVLCPSSFPFASGYEATINKQACRTAAGSAKCAGVSTAAPTTQSPTTTPKPGAGQCPCNIGSVWADIIVLIDGSNVLPDDKYNELVVMLQSFIYPLPIRQSLGMNTRLGVITYSTNVTTIATLNKYNSSIDPLLDNWIRYKTEMTNIKGAIDLARNYFDDPLQHRANARKVIILAASTYREGTPSPVTTANTFKDNEGVIMVIEYGDSNGVSGDVLKQVASTGYYIDGTDPKQASFGNLQALLCKANCFCPKPYAAVSNALTGEPAEGCFLRSDLEAMQLLAAQACANQNNGTLAATKTTNQKVYSTQSGLNMPVWVGLTRDPSTNSWSWSDGSPLTDAMGAGAGDCAYITRTNGFTTKFQPDYCTGSAHLWVCQTTPCSSGWYCG